MSSLDLIISEIGGLNLTVFVRARTRTGYSQLRRAHVDTGAPYSVLAIGDFEGIAYEPGPKIVAGRMELPECAFSAFQTQVTLQLEGRAGVRSPWLIIPVWLVGDEDAEKVPNLIGLAGVFEHADFHLSLRQSQAYFEFP